LIAGFVLEHVELGHRHARGDRDLLDDIAQASQVEVAAVLGTATPPICSATDSPPPRSVAMRQSDPRPMIPASAAR
jgi:hypothetical protein